jgi:nucleotide-binding universal stress UspA family protein
MKRILVAIDFSEVTDEVVTNAVTLQKALQGHLRVVHVDDSAPYFFYMPKDESPTACEPIEENPPPKGSNLEAIRNRMAKERVEADYRLIEGPAADNILAEANAFCADIIVIGAHRHGQFYHCLFGDTTTSLINHAPCPILVVPSKEKKSEGMLKAEG